MKDYLKKILPVPILSFLRAVCQLPSKVYEAYLVWTQPYLHRRALEKLRKKDGPVNVVFFAIFKSVWKYDRLYWLMEKDSRFHPVVLVCPEVNYGREEMLNTLRECYADFKERGYRVICSYDEQTDTYVDARSLDPDIIFYTNPYQGLIGERYYITRFRDVLTCYVSYHFGNSNNYQVFNNSLLQNLSWKLFVESEEHKKYFEKYTQRKGENVVVTGYPGVDRFVEKNPRFTDVWKIKDRRLKRIVWAPHHSFDESCGVHYSTFMRYHLFIYEMALKYKENIQIIFRPHPLLKIKLEQYWGKERADQYYAQWEHLENGGLHQGDYIDLFLSSDAIMHDCGSFIVEYLYTRKPALRIDLSKASADSFNPFAQKCLSMYYHADNEEQIENFIQDIISGRDLMKDNRERFYHQVLMPPNGVTASKNIFDYLTQTIFINPQK